jgi:hypothetical protein
VGATGVSLPISEIRRYQEAECQAIRDQLERMLTHPFFRHSKRYPTLLRYVVEHALDGRTEQMKERTLGIEVFGRSPDYDTNQDPVVRTTAGEIRKRIAQYYHLPEHQHEWRIELPIGTYMPEFQPPELPAMPLAPVLPPPTGVQRVSRTPLAIAAASGAASVIILGACLAMWLRPSSAPTALDRFWTPVLESSSSVLICLGQPHFGDFPAEMPSMGSPQTANPSTVERHPDNQTSLHDLYRMGKHHVALNDAITLSRVAGMLQTRGKTFRVRGLLSTSLADLRDGPVVLVGAFNNEWTLRLTGPLRYSFHKDYPIFSIVDQGDPTVSWKVDNSEPYLKITDDYGIISRVRDPTTGRFVVVAAGIAGWGTQAAGEFLADPKYMEEVAKTAPKDWERKNMQVVIATKVIAGNSSPPSVVATYFW